MRIIAWLTLAAAGCAGPAPPPAPPPPAATAPEPVAPAAPPEKEPVKTGSDCCTAEAQCGGGVCHLFIKNGCDQAHSCDASMTTTCKSGTDMMEATRRKRDTFAAKTEGEINLVGECTSGEVIQTAIKSVECK
jgi:hypothetical protein